MAFRGDGSTAGLSRNSDPPWTNSQRGVSIAAWVKYDGSGSTGVDTIAGTFNRTGTQGGMVRLFKSSLAYGGAANSDSNAISGADNIAGSAVEGAWKFVVYRYFSNTLRWLEVGSPSRTDIDGRLRSTASLTAHTNQTGVCVGVANNVTANEFLEPSFIVAHAMFFGHYLSTNEVLGLARGGHPLDPAVCRRPAQYYPLRDNAICAITGLRLDPLGTPEWVADDPGLIVRSRPALFLVRAPAPAASGVTGTLAATESGADTFASSGTVLVQGALAATESGSDTAAFAGNVIVQGELAATESGSDTFAATGSALTTSTGTLAATESGSDTAAVAGAVLIQGALAATESGADTFAATGGAVGPTGILAATESGTDTFASTGALIVQGSLAATESGADTAALTGIVLVAGVLAASEAGSDTFLATSIAPLAVGIVRISSFDGGTLVASVDGIKVA